ncbi:O-methyltransferase [Apiospora arundinis]
MGSVTTTAPASVMGQIEFFNGTNDGEAAYLDPVGGKHNFRDKKIMKVQMHDMRAQEPKPTLQEGKAHIQDKYWKEVGALVKERSGADQVIPWHFSVRKQALGQHPDDVFFKRTGVSQPASTVHIDNNHDSAMHHLTRVLGGEEAARQMRWPLFLVDHREVPGHFSYEKNVERIYRLNDPAYYKSHDNFLLHDPHYRFRYVSNLAPEEALLFRDFDSRSRPGQTFYGTPHGAFQSDATPEDAPARRSIEVRSFAFFGKKEKTM